MSNPARSNSTDRRIDFRTSVSLPAHIKVAGRARIPCRVLNVSASGALIEMSEDIQLPEHFRLDIDGDLFEAMCELRHSEMRRIGVEFTSNRQGALARYGG
ncbi:MAG: PilZ domain-containing protein [Hyphomicrobiaceae bacterium]|nr:PilZ domain-containing protein [Hyphomicrobiaceae bacterium]